MQIDAGVLDVDVTAGITIDGTTLSIDGTDDSNLTVTASGKDLDIAVAGGGTQELRLASAGTGASALHLNASAGGINIDSADMIDIDAADEITIDTTSADGHIAITSAHTAGQSILISANADAGAILDVDAGIIDIDAQDTINIDAADEIVVTTTSADGHISLVSAHTAGVALHIDANANAGSIVDIDAGVLDIDVTAATTIDTTMLTVTTDTATFTSANANDPLVTIKNTTNDADGARLVFVKDKGAAGAANDVAGLIQFYADDANQDQVLFSEIKSQVKVHTNGQEGGKFTISVAEHDGTSTAGLVVEDGDADGELDVTIGAGTSSVTTIAGTLDLGDRNITNVGDVDLDSISVADAATGINLDFSGANTAKSKITLADNLAAALVVTEGSNPYMTFITTDSSEVVMFTEDVQITDDDKLYFGTNKDWSIEYDEDGDDDLVMTGSDISIESSTSAKPVLQLLNTNADATGATLKFNKNGSSVADSDVIGNLDFVSEDDGGAVHTYAKMIGTIDVDAAGEESGKLQLKVASHDGGVEDGIVITGGSVDAEVDVTLGNGAASVTTVAGQLTATSGIAATKTTAAVTSSSSAASAYTGSDQNVRAGSLTVTMDSGHSVGAGTGTHTVTINCNKVAVTDTIVISCVNPTSDGSSAVAASLSGGVTNISAGTNFVVVIRNMGAAAVPATGTFKINWAII